MKICINIKVWQRPKVFESVLRSIRDQETKHDILIVCALSPDDPHIAENTESCSKHNVWSMLTPNLPLRAKGNMLCKFSRLFDWDYLMILGSDDVVGPGFFDAYPDDIAEGWGWSDLYLYDPPDRRFAYWPGYDPAKRQESVGAGRVLRRDVLDRLDWKIHGDGNKFNLDKSTTERLKRIDVTIPHSKLPDGVYMVDCKDSVSITKLSAFENLELMDVPAGIRGYL